MICSSPIESLLVASKGTIRPEVWMLEQPSDALSGSLLSVVVHDSGYLYYRPRGTHELWQVSHALHCMFAPVLVLIYIAIVPLR